MVDKTRMYSLIGKCSHKYVVDVAMLMDKLALLGRDFPWHVSVRYMMSWLDSVAATSLHYIDFAVHQYSIVRVSMTFDHGAAYQLQLYFDIAKNKGIYFYKKWTKTSSRCHQFDWLKWMNNWNELFFLTFRLSIFLLILKMMRYDEKSMHSFFKNIYTFCMFNQNRVLPLIRLCLQVFGRKKNRLFSDVFRQWTDYNNL